jgi:hypothetical protein
VVTGWEESGHIRVCLHPGPAAVRSPWPVVTVGRVGSPEDAVPVDLDGDGAVDVVSCCEGKTRSVFVHWAPPPLGHGAAPWSGYGEASAWRTEAVPVLQDVAMWMFCLPLQIDGMHGVDLVIGAKGSGAEVGWLEAPADARRLDQWRWHPLTRAGWIMSLRAEDMDGDGDADIVLSDRKGEARGCFWLENPAPGAARTQPWETHPIGALDREAMFLDIGDIDGDGLRDVAAATYTRELLWLQRLDRTGRAWREHLIALPETAGIGKAVAIGDLDCDGVSDLIVTSEKAGNGHSGVHRMLFFPSPASGIVLSDDLSGPAGTKFDRLEMIDLDDDGDLDVLTCEERENLGVVWYENPAS